jgi:hypothetical protein
MPCVPAARRIIKRLPHDDRRPTHDDTDDPDISQSTNVAGKRRRFLQRTGSSELLDRGPNVSRPQIPMKQKGDIRIGISGWRYKGWRGSFYPRGLKQADESQFASGLFQTVEINPTHYSLQSLDCWRRWYAQTPADFIFSVKGARYLTHLLRFRDERARVGSANFFAQGMLALNEKLGPLLWQFPPTFRFEPAGMERFLSPLGRANRCVAARLATRRRAADRTASGYRCTKASGRVLLLRQ